MDKSGIEVPEISVVIPSYNHEKYVGQAIDSVLSQEGCNFELIIVDDCSSDASKGIIERAASSDSRIRSMFHSSNMGIAQTLSECMDNASGKFILFLSSDDMLLPGALSKMSNAMKTDPATDVLIFDGDCIDDTGKSRGYSFWELHTKPPGDESDIFDALLRSNFILTAMIKMQTVRQKGLRLSPELEYQNDWVFWIDAASSCTFKIIRESLYAYRIHGGNTSFKDRWLEDSAKACTIILERHSKMMNRRQISVVEYFRGLSLVKIHAYPMGRRALFHSLSSDPLTQRGAGALLVFLLSFLHREGELTINTLGRLKFQRHRKLNMHSIREQYRGSAGKRD